MSDLLIILNSAVQQSTVLRIAVPLQSAMGDGMVYPPTYEQGKHVFRPAWVQGEQRDAVLLDSVQSQANRMEIAILDAYRGGKIPYPDIQLEVHASTGEESYSVLQLSHRIYDATLRMSEIDGVAFAQTELGKSIYSARADRATAIYTHAPITLALGGWEVHSLQNCRGW